MSSIPHNTVPLSRAEQHSSRTHYCDTCALCAHTDVLCYNRHNVHTHRKTMSRQSFVTGPQVLNDTDGGCVQQPFCVHSGVQIPPGAQGGPAQGAESEISPLHRPCHCTVPSPLRTSDSGDIWLSSSVAQVSHQSHEMNQRDCLHCQRDMSYYQGVSQLCSSYVQGPSDNLLAC